MKLSTRMLWAFGLLLMVALSITIGISYWELVVEAQDPRFLQSHGPDPVWLQLAEILFIVSPVIIVLSLGGWWITQRSLRPLEDLAAAARRINEGNLRDRLPLRGTGDEIDELTLVFNDMTSRLEASFQRIREFTLHASHELKTPLAILRADFGELVDEENRSEEDKLRFISHLDEIERLSRLVDGLNFLTKTDAKLVRLRPVEMDFGDLVAETVENCAALAERSQLQIHAPRIDSVKIMGDRHRLRQLLLILCDNAVKYNHEGGNINITLIAENGEARLSISNTGPGIPQKDQGRVFERFYRGENTTADSVDGSGLGLSIAYWISQEHSGKLSFTSSPEQTEFVLSLPTHQNSG
ncbi:MAG: ATP-binding protein [Prosthecobacter sp.]|nr:ATP-binding protein [Prosthecobacter sp.]